MSGETSLLSSSNLSEEAVARLTETYKQEYALQSALYPTLDDTPTCTELMYVQIEHVHFCLTPRLICSCLFIPLAGLPACDVQ